MFLPKGSMEISMYPVTLRLTLLKKNAFTYKRVLGNFHVSSNIETNIIQKCFTERVQGNFHVSCNIETNSKMFLPKWSMEISTYLVTLRLYQELFTQRVNGIIQVSCNIMTLILFKNAFT